MTDEHAELTAKLPPLPNGLGHGGDGYVWMELVRAANNGWESVGVWGSAGWSLGSWPLVIVTHLDGEGLYGAAVYVEGDITTHAFATREERDAKTDEIAFFYWHQYKGSLDAGPDDLANRIEDMAPEHRGPFEGWR